MECFLNKNQQNQYPIIMRAYRLIPLLAIALLSSACTKEYVTKEYITEETIIQGAEMNKIDFTVNTWQVNDGYFSAVLPVPEIDDDIVKEGNVEVLLHLTNDIGETVWTPLPRMIVSYDSDLDFYYTTFTDFEWGKGYVSIFVTTTDLFTGDNPGSMSFRVIILR